MNNRIFKQLAGAVIAILLMAVSAFGQGASASHNANGVANRADNGRNKIAADLDRVLNGQGNGRESWVKPAPGGSQLSLVIVSNAKNDPQLGGLRRAIVAVGGAIKRQFSSINGLAATVPAARVRELAQRTDVFRITPNRMVARASSMLEMETGADVVRTLGAAGAFDGSGVGIAFLDSGIMSTHASMLGVDSASRVRASVDFTSKLATLDSPVDNSAAAFQDPYGHGTLVASIAAGRSAAGGIDSTGIAPGASLYDVRVLDDRGFGDIATTIAGIDWVMAHAAQYGIRVVNISLGTSSSDSYLTDPLCASARAAVAAGLVVVVAAGNYGTGPDGKPMYGTISSPGDEPSVITVGSAKDRGTVQRGDDAINVFSGRGPTRGSYVDDTGTLQHDNLLKPDLVAPGNRVIGALSTDRAGLAQNALAAAFPQLVLQAGPTGNGLMSASGTSFAAPVVAGTAALLLQANPGLTPPLVKAMLQYTAQPLAGYNLLDQGAGLVDVPGALALAGALDTHISVQVSAGGIAVGAPMLAAGQAMPAPISLIDGAPASWSRFVYMGGRHVLAGEKLFTQYQAAYDPRLLWVGSRAAYVDPTAAAPSGALVSDGVVSLTQALGASSPVNDTGYFTLSSDVTDDILHGEGIVLAEGLDLTDGIVLAEGIDLTDGIVLAEGIVLSESIVLAEGLVLAEGIVLSEGLVLAEQALILGERP